MIMKKIRKAIIPAAKRN